MFTPLLSRAGDEPYAARGCDPTHVRGLQTCHQQTGLPPHRRGEMCSEGEFQNTPFNISIFAGFCYGVREALIVPFQLQHWNKAGKAVFGPARPLSRRSFPWRSLACGVYDLERLPISVCGKG